MKCRHKGLHAIRTAYDQRAGILVFFWVCEVCGKRLGEVHRQSYRPRFDRCDRHPLRVRQATVSGWAARPPSAARVEDATAPRPS